MTLPILVQKVTIKTLARLEPTDIVAAHQVEEFGRMGAADLENAHVGHVEQAGRPAHGIVLVQDPRVPDGHLPAGKGDHFAGVGLVPIIERCALQRRVFWIFPAKLGQLGAGAHGVQILAADKVGHRQLETISVTGPVQVDRR